MSGEVLYRAPSLHRCVTPPLEPYGSVWRCGECGAYWRVDALPLMAIVNWHPMGRFAVWRFRRRQARRR